MKTRSRFVPRVPRWGRPHCPTASQTPEAPLPDGGPSAGQRRESENGSARLRSQRRAGGSGAAATTCCRPRGPPPERRRRSRSPEGTGTNLRLGGLSAPAAVLSPSSLSPSPPRTPYFLWPLLPPSRLPGGGGRVEAGAGNSGFRGAAGSAAWRGRGCRPSGRLTPSGAGRRSGAVSRGGSNPELPAYFPLPEVQLKLLSPGLARPALRRPCPPAAVRCDGKRWRRRSAACRPPAARRVVELRGRRERSATKASSKTKIAKMPRLIRIRI